MTASTGSKRSQVRSSNSLEGIAKAGLIAYGIVHLLIGWLAMQLALGDNSGQADSDGAIRQLAQQPYGLAAVVAIGVGMLLMTAWQGIEAFIGHEREDGAKQLAKKATSAGKAVLYLFIGVNALRIAFGSGSSSGGSGGKGGGKSGTDSLTAVVLDMPGGQVLVGFIGLAVIAAGGILIWKGIGDRFQKDLDAEGSSGDKSTLYTWLGRIGYWAKGMAIAGIGVLFIVAAVNRKANASGGIDEALKRLLDQPFGPWLAIAIAAGFIAFGLFCFAWATHLDRSRNKAT